MRTAAEIQLELDAAIASLAAVVNRDGLLARDLEARRRVLTWVLEESEWATRRDDSGATTE